MGMLSARLTKLEQAGTEGKPIIVVVEKDETQEQAFARAKRHPHRLVIIVDLHGCLDDPS